MLGIVQTVRGQREHARKCSGAHCNHQQQAQPKPAYGCGQDKRADAERSTDLPAALTLLSVKLWQHGGHD